ncbi:hypothetical protein yc1106_03573 [Curvularia clavata]|uniref:Uncharacterized protein n=1 Tax=Curvularia clavata TaxID=95742 RepID=A0A9Q9DS22_CURCL|nr:hypothetical protein yc1106_03573 [Curvularia clavata]
MIRDPQFWNRFSVAVHQDDLEKQLTSQDPKHSYVSTTRSCSPLSPAHSPLGSPTSQIHLPPSSPGQPPMVQLASLRVSVMSTPLSPLSLETPLAESPVSEPKRASRWSKNKKTRSYLQKTPSTRPLLRPDIASTRQASTSTPPPFSSEASSPQYQKPAPPSGHHLDPSSLPASPSRAFFRAPNLSTVSLSFSGRPASRFKFVTTITADASHRDSWLVRQKKKERHRTWLCWAFWLAFLVLVAGVVATVLVLKHKKII